MGTEGYFIEICAKIACVKTNEYIRDQNSLVWNISSNLINCCANCNSINARIYYAIRTVGIIISC